jgi:hypothetical protein
LPCTGLTPPQPCFDDALRLSSGRGDDRRREVGGETGAGRDDVYD